MPVVAEDAMGAKLVSFYPANAGTGIPTHMGMIMLLRPDTGQPLALLDGRLVTQMRTAAVSAAVTKHVAASESRVLSALGQRCSGKGASRSLVAGSGLRTGPRVHRASPGPGEADEGSGP
jgi:thiomorpholine-carboxylate dehydrogenase